VVRVFGVKVSIKLKNTIIYQAFLVSNLVILGWNSLEAKYKLLFNMYKSTFFIMILYLFCF